MKGVTLGWIIFVPLAVVAVWLYLDMPRGAVLVCLFAVILLLARLFVGRRM